MINGLTVRLNQLHTAQRSDPAVNLNTLQPHPDPSGDVKEEIAMLKDFNTQKFEDVVHDSQQVLLRIKAVFPFDFFPNEIVVDLKNVSIITHELFYKKVHSVYIQDISDVLVHEGILFASIELVDKFFKENSITVKWLHKDEAMRARNMIQGLMVGSREVDMTKVESENIEEKVEAIGAVQESPA